MPRTTFPPTPGSSTDIKGQDGTQKLASLQLAFELPPPAMHDRSPSSASRLVTNSTTTTNLGQVSPTSPHSSAYPMQPAEAVKARRRSSAAGPSAGKESSFTLPPPPTRSRKIIQMQPPQQNTAGVSTSTKARGTKGSPKGKGKASTATATSRAVEKSAEVADGPAGKKKQPSATSAAGRKIARKTAHSLIERRRRSKMNEEFGVLKDMIPACTGEMHKLAILQEAIGYVRYLQQCVDELKAHHDENQNRPGQPKLPSIHEFHPRFRDGPELDVEMTDGEVAVSPTFTTTPEQADLRSRQTSISSASPALHAQPRSRQQSYSSISTSYRAHGYNTSATTSPAFGPQGYVGWVPSSLESALPSPALKPQPDPDHEATAALLMLNSDRRNDSFSVGGSRLSVSVRDLLAP